MGSLGFRNQADNKKPDLADCQLTYYIDPLAEIDTKTIGRFESVRGPVCAGRVVGVGVEEAVFLGAA